MSAIRLQNTDGTNSANTVIQMKNARAIQVCSLSK